MKTLKIFIFSIIPLFAVLIFATILLKNLEHRDIIYTERPDDLVTYLTGELYEKTLINGKYYYVINQPTMIVSSFPVEKGSNTYRIFLVGESFVMGIPYVDQRQILSAYGDMSNWLWALLSMRYPNVNFEVINAGGASENSIKISQVVDELIKVHPDLIIIAAGNNEGWVQTTSLNQELHQWAVYRALKKTLLPSVIRSTRPYFAPQDPDTQAIEKQFQKNINHIISSAQKMRVPILFCTMPINWRYDGGGPQVEMIPMVAHDKFIVDGIKLMDNEQYERANDVFLQSSNSVLAMRYIAELYEKQGQVEKAKDFYRSYVQALPLNRTRPSYNNFIRSIVKEHGLLYVDLESIADNQSPTGIADKELFWDWCHLTWQGYYLMAREIQLVMIDKIFKSKIGTPLQEPTVQEIIDRYHWQALYTTYLDRFGWRRR